MGKATIMNSTDTSEYESTLSFLYQVSSPSGSHQYTTHNEVCFY
jgi:hypothetical protein